MPFEKITQKGRHNFPIILAYHSIGNKIENPLLDGQFHDISSDSFYAQIRFLKENFDTVHVDELVCRILAQKDVNGLAAITFEAQSSSNASPLSVTGRRSCKALYCAAAKSFCLSCTPAAPAGTSPGFLVSKVTQNGVRIGATGSMPPNYSTAWTLPRKYPLPSKLVRKDGENVIAVRVYDGTGGGGIYDRTPGILSLIKTSR